ncbi:MAG TPA: gephyrin-like molybdotransferase Glp [Isosphaeraceae bacterium]|jgi:molybdopterin molybdotransferase|nr:gephyrin-like molybdotransferase Glp [Isosphaeraceae bacterium]
MGGDRQQRFDPRGQGFRSLAPVADVLARIDATVGPLGVEPVRLADAAGRVLAAETRAAADIPPFDRSAMDGFAVRGRDVQAAGPEAPAALRVIGEARPGRPFSGVVGPGEAVDITTGAPLPAGADAVVRVEATVAAAGLVRVVEPTPVGRHVGRRGEDIAAGTVVLRAGRVLRPQDLGALSALGRAEVPVVRRPAVAVVITGDELLPPGTPAVDSRIADTNSVMLMALIARDGGLARVVGPVRDDRATLRDAIAAAARSADAVLVSGGSSTGAEDHAPGIVADLGTLEFHGVALRPASPAGLGRIGEVPVVLLPGNPVSCLCAYDFFAGRVVRRLGGRASGWSYVACRARLARPIASAVDRVDYVRVLLADGRAEPITSGGASILSSATRADGFLVVPADVPGLAAGDEVVVWRYDPPVGATVS